MAERKYKITDYTALNNYEDLKPADSFLVARQEEYQYYSMPWSVIQSKFDLKADAVENTFGEVYGLVKVNEQGIVTGIKGIEEADLPTISVENAIFYEEAYPESVMSLTDILSRKVDKTFAQDTWNYVVGAYEIQIQNEAGSGKKKPYIEIKTTYVSTEGELSVETIKNIKSPDNTIIFSKDELTNDVLVKVDPVKLNKQSDWNQEDTTAADFIKNKPELAQVALSGDYNDLSNKLEFENGSTSRLDITKDENSNTYKFTVFKPTFGDLEGEVEDSEQLVNKFGYYYTAQQVDELLANISIADVLKVKGYISRVDPSYRRHLEKGTLWFESYTAGSPEVQSFVCKKYTDESGPNKWETISYTADNFDLWININSSEDNSFFWLASKWEQLDFSVDLSKYYTKTEIDTKLSGKQNTLSGTAGTVATYTDTPGRLTETPLAPVAVTGSYNDLDDLPEITQSDWEQDDPRKPDYIKNKPELAPVATSGSYNDLTDKPEVEQSDWEEEDPSKAAYIKNKPNIVTELTITSIYLTHLDYNFANHCYTINLEDIPDDEFYHEVYWNGVLQREYYEYILDAGGRFFQTEDIEIDTEVHGLLVSSMKYVMANQTRSAPAQSDWTIDLTKIEDSSNQPVRRSATPYLITIHSDTLDSSIKIYKDLELIDTLYLNDSDPDYAKHLIYSNEDSFKITGIRGTPDSDVVGTITNMTLYLLGDSYPLEEDINDIMTIKYYQKMVID